MAWAESVQTSITLLHPNPFPLQDLLRLGDDLLPDVSKLIHIEMWLDGLEDALADEFDEFRMIVLLWVGKHPYLRIQTMEPFKVLR